MAEQIERIPRVHVLKEFRDSETGEITGQITSSIGSDGTWIQFNCSCLDALPTCFAQCCALRGTYLTEEEANTGEFDCYPEPDTGLPVLRRDSDGFCVYLDRDTRRCSIYESRPIACQKFHCTRAADTRGWKLANHVDRQSTY